MKSISTTLSQKPLRTTLDTTNTIIPGPCPVYFAYDNQLNPVTSNSGALQVENPTTVRKPVHANAADSFAGVSVRDELEQLLTQKLTIDNDGFLHVEACPELVEWVSNGSADKEINFDNFLITTAKGKVWQINHYYPYGLRIAGLDGYSHDYTSTSLSAGKNMYTGKELQMLEMSRAGTSGDSSSSRHDSSGFHGGMGELHLPYSTGLEMYDFHARFYDPQLGRWFAPDPAEQFSNPYLAMGNNPVMYVDPDGEFVVVDSWIIGFIDGFFSKSNDRFSNGFEEANRRAWNDIKIYGGLFASDENKSGGARFLEVLSRFTWQLPQSVGGFLTAQLHNTLGLRGGVESVDYKYGATVVRTRNSDWGAVAQGSYIVGDNSIRPDAHNPLFQHEYGHYLQSQAFGFAYYPRVGIPSLRSASRPGGGHIFHPVEQDANARAFVYFNENVEDFYVEGSESGLGKGWDFTFNPISLDGTRRRVYHDFQDVNTLAAIKGVYISPKWYDYASWISPVVGPIAVGLINSRIYLR